MSGLSCQNRDGWQLFLSSIDILVVSLGVSCSVYVPHSQSFAAGRVSSGSKLVLSLTSYCLNSGAVTNRNSHYFAAHYERLSTKPKSTSSPEGGYSSSLIRSDLHDLCNGSETTHTQITATWLVGVYCAVAPYVHGNFQLLAIHPSAGFSSLNFHFPIPSLALAYNVCVYVQLLPRPHLFRNLHIACACMYVIIIIMHNIAKSHDYTT